MPQFGFLCLAGNQIQLCDVCKLTLLLTIVSSQASKKEKEEKKRNLSTRKYIQEEGYSTAALPPAPASQVRRSSPVLHSLTSSSCLLLCSALLCSGLLALLCPPLPAGLILHSAKGSPPVLRLIICPESDSTAYIRVSLPDCHIRPAIR